MRCSKTRKVRQRDDCERYRQLHQMQQRGSTKPALSSAYTVLQIQRQGCCRSAHDDHIKSQYQSLLSSTCLRKFQSWKCTFASAAIRSEYVDMESKKVHVCPAFAKAMWQKTNFDRCGLNLEGGNWPVVMPVKTSRTPPNSSPRQAAIL